MTDASPNILPLRQPGPSLYRPTKHTNLVIRKGGVYWVRAKVGNQTLKKSLKTRVESVALSKRDKLIEQARRRAGRKDGVLKWGQLAAEYRARINGDRDLRDASKKYRLETIEAIERTWADIGARTVESLTTAALATWADELRGKYSATRYNATVETMRAILKSAVERGHFAANPIDEALRSEAIKRAPIVVRDRTVPTPKQLDALFKALKPNKGKLYTSGTRTSNAYYLARFLRHFSLRVGTALKLTMAMVKRDAEEFHIPSEIVKWGGKGKLYRVPIFPEMFKVLAELDRAFGKREMVLPFRCNAKPLKRACRDVGIEEMSWHDFRHVFSTYALMVTKDPILVSSWRGDKDRGATLLRVYSHILDSHSRKAARRVK